MSDIEDIDRILHPDRILASICMITYRHESFIAEAIEGVLAQQLNGAFELVISDDKSPDGTPSICRQYQQRYPEQIRLLLPQRNLGMARNLELALDKCRGRYVAFCEGDDIWSDPFKLAKQVAVLESDATCSGSYHETRLISENGERTGHLFRTQLPDQLSVQDVMSELAPFHTSSFVIRASPLLHALPSWTMKVASLDMALFALVAGTGTLRKVDGVMSSYRKHPGGITRSQTHTGATFHYQRILLWLFLDRHFNHAHADRCRELFLFHWRFIIKQSTPRARLKFLASLCRNVPTWFSHNPFFIAKRMFEAVQP
ncbi:MAG TPA: glycosyltransferase [Flavobacteriales bacterium]|nr:glycosyltransferase [Flavobacteriales bacterium]QQS73617.1 MAG: glycosyltransferase [Flavobacteriales bacterium]HQV37360.1 glycosyltransferase [Flavobacteriales bacterium]HQW31097.1 glycosyltransferase [Flavobacteriales bacterium]HQY02977.1 glycosyltransferase [Flavobacteriales bacterium]